MDPITWQPSVSNELGRLAGGIRDVKGNNAIKFVSKSSILPHEKVTYANMTTGRGKMIHKELASQLGEISWIILVMLLPLQPHY